MKVTTLVLIWTLFLTMLSEASQQENTSKSDENENKRFTSKTSHGTLATANNKTGREGEEHHNNQDHRDEDEAEFIIPALLYTHIHPAQYPQYASFLSNWSALHLRICCRNNYI